MPLQRLNSEARAVIELANTIAHEYELEYVGTEHILLAILRHHDNTGARALRALGVDELTARTKLDEITQRALEDTWVFGRLPGSPHYRNVIERALQISEQLESNAIGPEDLLLGLFQDEDSAAQQVLRDLGVTPTTCRDEVLRQLSATD
jgi:ATP-dependent Clp protease ATP-binding subunit ClpC